MMMGRSQAILCSKWLLPGFCLALGLVILIVNWVSGHLAFGLISLAFMAVFGVVVLLLARHNETIRGLTIGRDERFVQIDLRATAFTGLVLLVTLIVAWLIQLAHGHTGHPYDWLLAVGGLAYVFAVALFRWRG
jgi:archaellum biogenesis protein FlaJ (TadC family)